MKKSIRICLFGFLGALILGGCYSEELGKRPQEQATTSAPKGEIRPIGENLKFDEECRKLGTAMLSAMKSENFDAFIQLLPPEMVKIYTKEMFDAQNKELASRFGKIDTYEFIDSVDSGIGRTYIWTVKSQLPAPPGTDKAVVKKSSSLVWTNLFYINAISVDGNVSLRGFREIPLL